MLLQCIFFDFPFHCNARPTNHKTHVVLYFTLRSRSENVFFEKKIQERPPERQKQFCRPSHLSP